MTFCVRFTADYIFTPPEDRRVAVKYLAGKTYFDVRRLAAERAVAASAAEILRDPLDHDGDGRKGGSRPRGHRRSRPPRARKPQVVNG